MSVKVCFSRHAQLSTKNINHTNSNNRAHFTLNASLFFNWNFGTVLQRLQNKVYKITQHILEGNSKTDREFLHVYNKNNLNDDENMMLVLLLQESCSIWHSSFTKENWEKALLAVLFLFTKKPILIQSLITCNTIPVVNCFSPSHHGCRGVSAGERWPSMPLWWQS